MATELDVELRGGATVRTCIDGSGPPAVLCHGGPGLWDYTGGLAALVHDHLTVHRWHQRGCGPSTPVSAYGIDVALSDVQELKAAWRVDDPWIVMGHSWGAYLALATALRHPESTAAVVYVSGTGTQAWWSAEGRAAYKAARSARLGPAREARLEHLATATERTPEEERDFRALSWCTDVADADPTNPGLLEMIESPYEIRFDINRSLIATVEEEQELLAGLARCDVPFLVLHGSEDPRPAGGARLLAESLPNATFHLVEGAGHLPWIERPDALRDLIASFVA